MNIVIVICEYSKYCVLVERVRSVVVACVRVVCE